MNNFVQVLFFKKIRLFTQARRPFEFNPSSLQIYQVSKLPTWEFLSSWSLNSSRTYEGARSRELFLRQSRAFERKTRAQNRARKPCSIKISLTSRLICGLRTFFSPLEKELFLFVRRRGALSWTTFAAQPFVSTDLFLRNPFDSWSFLIFV